MKILGIDTTTKVMCLGIYDGVRTYAYNLEVGVKLSSILDVTLKRVLEALGLDIRQIDYFACGLGPGSFTGIRIGMATIKGLSWSLKKPVLGIASLDILAQNAKDANVPVVTLLDAKRNLIYCSVYKKKNGHLLRVKPYMLLSEMQFFKIVADGSVMLGDAAGLYREKIFKHIKGATILDRDCWYPKANHLIQLALQKLTEKKFNSAFDIKPIYLYPKECQVRTKNNA